MLALDAKASTLSIPRSLRVVGVASVMLGLATVDFATLAYLPEHPGMSFSNTFLSDIRDTPGWPQVLFNSGTLMSAPLRIVVLAWLVLRMSQLGTGRVFGAAILIIGSLSALGIVLMTAGPFSSGPAIHKTGIALYFFGVVVMQTVIGVRELRLKGVPRLLPVTSFMLAGAFAVFVALMMLYERDIVGRGTSEVWQWAGFALSIAWLLAHSLILGEEAPPTQRR